MRTARLLLPGLALLAGALGCCTIQKTAGICDCNPPPVESVLLPPPRPSPMGGIIRHSIVVPHHANGHPAAANPIPAPPSNPAPPNVQPAPAIQPPLHILPPVRNLPNQPANSATPPMPRVEDPPTE